jgi:hypothetical protein
MTDVFRCEECNKDVLAKPRANSDFFDCPTCLNAVGYRVTKPDVTFVQGDLRKHVTTSEHMPTNWTSALEAMTNPKTLMGRQKLSVLSVVPPASILREAEAMHYGAYQAARKDGTKGYGPYNWRDDPVEVMIYVDACMRHLFAFVDGEGADPESGVSHLGHAKACLGIIADADANGTLIDNRPAVRKSAASSLLNRWKLHHEGEPK